MIGFRRPSVAAACGMLLLGAAAFAQDWPQWRGPNRDGKATGFSAPATWPKELAPTWKAKVGEGCATPALVGDALYVFARQGGDEVTLCLGAADGKEVWKDACAAMAVSGPAGRHPGPRSSPVVLDGKVVTLGVGGVLSCLEAGTGKVVWRKDPFPKVVPTFFTGMSPIVVDGMAIAHLGKGDQGALIAFDLASGDEKWRWAGEGPDYGSPVLLTQLVLMTEKSIAGIGTADGKLLWRRPFEVARRAYNAATPIVDGQTVVYTGAKRGTHAVKIEKAGDAFSATSLWDNADVATQFNSPVLKDGLLFGLSDGGSLFCLDAKTGKTAWVDGAQRDRSGFTALVDAGPVLLALPSDGSVVVFKPDGAAYAEVAKIKVADTPTYATPVVAGKRIFVKDQESVALYLIE